MTTPGLPYAKPIAQALLYVILTGVLTLGITTAIRAATHRHSLAIIHQAACARVLPVEMAGVLVDSCAYGRVGR